MASASDGRLWQVCQVCQVRYDDWETEREGDLVGKEGCSDGKKLETGGCLILPFWISVSYNALRS